MAAQVQAVQAGGTEAGSAAVDRANEAAVTTFPPSSTRRI
jgi:hypothetical protein